MNPYKVLGVSENATAEEIRAAYLTLVKKYHPDKYADGPLKEMAGEKLKEINQAYETLTKQPRTTQSNGYGGGYGNPYGSGYGGYNTGSYQRAGSTYSGPYADELQRARSYISQNNLVAARSVLDGIGVHNAEWNYLYGVIYLRQNWYDKARECFRAAYEAEPDNPEYRTAYGTVNNAGSAYGGRTFTGGTGTGNCMYCNICPALLLCDCLTRGICCC